MAETAAVHQSERRQQVAAGIRRRLVANIAAGGTLELAPTPLENDPAVYTSVARAEEERHRLFLERPLLVGLSHDIPAPGDILLFEEVGPSIAVVRGNDGVLRGFLNMCTHRASKLVSVDGDRCARRERLSCPFHAWTFELDGTLAGVPGRQGFAGIDLAQRNLVPVPVAEWNGLVFVQVTGRLDLEAHLGAFAPELAQLELATARPVQSSRLRAETNWKLALDTYCEGYHFSTLHADTIGVSHYSNVTVFDAFRPHWRMNFPARGLADLVHTPEEAWPAPEYEGIHFLFPNTILVIGSVSPGLSFARIFRLFPGRTPGSMACHFAVYVIGGATFGGTPAEAIFTHDDATSVITQEDYRMAVEAYANLLHAPPGFKVVYGRNEMALQQFHRSLAEALGSAV